MTDSGPFDLLIRGCTALTSDPAMPMIEDAAIGIRRDRLVFVGKDAPGRTATRVIEGRGHLATPGFVNVHTHAVLSLARGMT
ncbi:MAG: hydrolase, partial [Alphaproteobacteria bacterium]|nr:hydrolase [Alphaproteobacteria bacterium]